MTNNKQQTAVEWFIEQIEEKGDLRETPSIRNIQLNIDTTEYLDLKRQAKEMEKEKIIEAYHQGVTDEYGDALEFGDVTDGEVYYNKLYGKI
jgi:hypothetical protein